MSFSARGRAQAVTQFTYAGMTPSLHSPAKTTRLKPPVTFYDRNNLGVLKSLATTSVIRNHTDEIATHLSRSSG